MISLRCVSKGCGVLVLLSVLGCDSSRQSPESLVAADPPFIGLVQPSLSLENPAALAALRKSNPEHFRKINELLAGLSAHTELDRDHWAKVSFGADKLSVSPVLYTSLPPKQYVTFNLDGTNYTALVPQPPYLPPTPASR